MTSLGEVLGKYTQKGELYEFIDSRSLRCVACGHRCPIPDGYAGVCKVRRNEGGNLLVPWGYVAAVQCDPIEKKPFFHAYPGSLAYSFGMLGCDLHCAYCQNWVTSQAIRDPEAAVVPVARSPAQLVKEASDLGANLVVSTYNEPLITAEWSVSIFKEARSAGLGTGFVSNGNATPEVIEYLTPWLDLYKVDLKSFNDRHYRSLGGRLKPILDTISDLYKAGIWLEIVTLLVPGFNDDACEIRDLTQFIAGICPEIPWHVTAFHKDYKMKGHANTTSGMLSQAAVVGRESGLKFVYAGNLPGEVGDFEHTFCPNCGESVIERQGYQVLSYSLTAEGKCVSCGVRIPGRWASTFKRKSKLVSSNKRIP